ncbi:uncharacterized protein LOC135484488 isoform X1 [Lineus longissimus]|uniref:uncharacterized protein LOC135484488 isoform X1 n=1 Tax=Lineus longissimus TaxID=88925 RepID=UPI00315DF348
MERRSPVLSPLSRCKHGARQPTFDSSDDELSSGEISTTNPWYHQTRRMNPSKKEHRFGFGRGWSPGRKKKMTPRSLSPEPGISGIQGDDQLLRSGLRKSGSIEDLIASSPHSSSVQRTPHRKYKKGRIRYVLAMTGAKLGATPLMNLGDSSQKMCSVGVQTLDPESLEEQEADVSFSRTGRRCSQTQTDQELLNNLRQNLGKPEVVRSHSSINIGIDTDVPMPSQSNVEKAMKCLAVGSLDTAKDKYRYNEAGRSVDEVMLPAKNVGNESMDKSSDYYSMSIGSLSSANLLNLDGDIPHTLPSLDYLSPYDTDYRRSIGSRKSSTGDSAVDMRMPLSDDDHSDATTIPDKDFERRHSNATLTLPDNRISHRVSFCNVQTPSFTTISNYVPAPPSVVISDYSSPADNQYSQATPSFDFTENTKKNRLCVSPLSDVGSSAGSGSDYSDAQERPISESGSSRKSSWSEGSSFCSVDEDEVTDPELPSSSIRRTSSKKTSSWRKIRNVVHWSPFVQQFKKYRYPWVQLAGHQGNFKAGEQGTILKKLCSREQKCLQTLMTDVLRPYVPEYLGIDERQGETYIQMQDLLCEFRTPCVMDCKIGVRTYLEEELQKARKSPQLRKDMYDKMVEIDPDEPTDEERQQLGITKPRYMQWRETTSSTSSLGFRIEGIKKQDGSSSKDFKTTKTKDKVKEHLQYFTSNNKNVLSTYIRRLKVLRATMESSEWFQRNEVIGSSLLFVHDDSERACVWMIDFGKTVKLPENVYVDHRSPWVEGNREDGYLFGVDNLIDIFEETIREESED